MALCAIWLWISSHSRNTGQPSQPVLVTSALGWADSPAFSPDGKEIAYSWALDDDADRSIYAKLIGTGTELRLTTPPGRDLGPRWSPDGRFIAFFRQVPSAAGYYIVSGLGGVARQILRRNSDNAWGLDWAADGKHLVIVADSTQSTADRPSLQGAHPLRLVLADIDSGAQTVLTSPPSGAIGDMQPSVSPDGQRLAFVRVSADGLSEIYSLGWNSRKLRQLTHYGAVVGRIAWTADSREIVFNMFRNEGPRLWRIPIDGDVARPITSTTENVSGPDVARHDNRLAYVVGTANQNLWRIDLVASNPPAASAVPTRLIYANRIQGDPMYSPDGGKLAFSSTRMGANEIWVSNADGSRPMQLTYCNSFSGSPRWSPDGSAITFDSRMDGNPEIYVVPSEGGPPEGCRVRRITNNPAEDVVPSWSRDGKWIYFSSNRDGEFQIWKVLAATGESPSRKAVRVTQGGGIDAFETPDDRYLYFAKGRGKAGLWRRSLRAEGGGHEEPVFEQLQYWGLWALGSNGIYFLDVPAIPHEKVHLKFFDLQSTRTTELTTLSKSFNRWDPAITLSPDGRHLVYEQLDSGGSNIAIVDNFH
jgi:Tol biopolymer transport system component